MAPAKTRLFLKIDLIKIPNMNKYLLRIYGWEENEFYGFISDKTKKELSIDLKLQIDKFKKRKEDGGYGFGNLKFGGKKVHYSTINRAEIITLDEFWQKAYRKR